MLTAAVAVARADVRRRWRSLVAVGAVAGLAGGAAGGAVAALRRTVTAPTRLERAVHVEDIRVITYGNDAARQVATGAGVRRSWVAGIGIGRMASPGLAYTGVLAGPPQPTGLFTPVVVQGRAADPRKADEVVVVETLARQAGVRPGAVLDLGMLGPDQLNAFAGGPIDPTGPRLHLQVVGIVRLTGLPADDQTPVLGTPALFAAHPEAFGIGASAFIQLRGGRGAARSFSQQAARSVPPATPGSAVPPVEIVFPADARAPVEPAIRIVRNGLWVTIALLAAAGLIAIAQAMTRDAAAAREDLDTEAALGMAARDRASARALAAAPAAVVAATLTASGVVLAGRVAALGPARHLDPHPGWAPNAAVAAAGGSAAAVAVVLCAYLAVRLAGTPAAGPPVISRLVPAGRSVWATMGARAAIGSGRGRRLSSALLLAAGAVAVTGVVASAALASSLHRLTSDPGRWGWNANLAVLDATGALADRLSRDPAVAGASLIRYAETTVGGETTEVYAVEPLKGSVTWTFVSGRGPAAPAPGLPEVALGTRVADRLDRHVGDDVVLNGRRARVVGIGLGPALQSERLGASVLVAPDQLAAFAPATPTTDALVRWKPGTAEAGRAVVAGAEQLAPTRPADIEHLAALGRLPESVGIPLALVFLAVQAHAVASGRRHGAADVAVARAVGFTRRQASGTVFATVAAGAAIGIVAGTPLGLGVARLLWWALAHDAGAATDLSVPFAVVAATVTGLLVAGLALAAPASRRTARGDLAQLLRSE